MEVLELDGKHYVKASKAARDAGYTADYVGQLCRAGKVPAHLVGRSWYVDADQLGTHRVEKKRASRVKAREQIRRDIKKTLEDKEVKVPVRAARGESHSFLPRIAHKTVNYEEDEAELMPTVRKLDVSVDAEKKPSASKKKGTTKRKVVAPRISEETEKEASYSVENEGEKILMSGSINVIDVSDSPTGAYDVDATVLTPTIIKTKPEKAAKSHKATKTAPTPVATKPKIAPGAPVVQKPVKSTFEEKLGFMSETENTTEEYSEEDVQTMHEEIPLEQIGEAEQGSGNTIPIISIGLSVAVVLLTLSTFLEGQWVYSSEIAEQGGRSPIASGYVFDHSDLFAQIPFK